MNKGTKGFLLGMVVGVVAYHIVTQGASMPSTAASKK